jgi:shikimate kinase
MFARKESANNCELPANSTTMKRSIRIVELVGLAGSGKSTLAQTLSQRNEITLVDKPPYFRRIKDIPFFVRNTLLLLPTFFHLRRNKNGRWLAPEEMVWMVILQGWHQVLRCQGSDKRTMVVLDEGPVFFMALLYDLGPSVLRSRSAKQWWHSTYKQWANTLDMVIWLDASDATLVERIRSRVKSHRIKVESDPEAVEFLARRRIAYEQLLSALTAEARDLPVLRFDTEQEPLEQISDQVIAAFDFEHNGD